MFVQTLFQGQPCLELSLPQGDSVRVALHGAQVLSWTTTDGVERLYLSSNAIFDGRSPIRGGIPICFPQFNQRTLGGLPLPKHGFARTHAWEMVGSADAANVAGKVQLQLRSDAASRALWPHEFVACITVQLLPGILHLNFDVTNTGNTPWPFALALHTYLKVDDIAGTTLQGLDDLDYWDGVRFLNQAEVRLTQLVGPLTFTSETDRVYEGVQSPLIVRHAGGLVSLTQSTSMADTVVWNPGAERCAAIDDMPPDGYRQMLCVEAACINAPVVLQPGQSWQGWQHLHAA